MEMEPMEWRAPSAAELTATFPVGVHTIPGGHLLADGESVVVVDDA